MRRARQGGGAALSEGLTIAVRTARLAFGTSAPVGVQKTVYTCPPGRTAIVKDVRLYAGSAAVTQAALSVHSGPDHVALVVQALAFQEAIQRQGFIVLEPGDTVRVFSAGQPFTFHISGAELDGVAP